MIKPINPHYSMEAVPTVFDEEAMTSLELTGRTAHKVNEVVKAVNDHIAHCEEEHKKVRDSIPGAVAEEVQKHIENGEFDQQISHYANELIGRMDNLITNGEENIAEVVDSRLTAYNETLPTAGEAIRTQFRVLADAFRPACTSFTFTPEDWVEGEYYSTSNGGRGEGTGYWRSKFLLPFPEHKLISTYDEGKVLITCYDRKGGYLGYITGLYDHGNIVPKCTPTGTAYIGVTADTYAWGANGGHLEIHTLDTSKCDWIPAQNDLIFENEWNPEQNTTGYSKRAIFNEGTYINEAGLVVQAPKSWCHIVFPVEGMRKVYTSAKVQTSGIFFDGNGRPITNVTHEDMVSVGRVYNVPWGAVYCAINFTHAKDVNGLYYDEVWQYVTFVWENRPDLPLNGKRVLVIGDSLAWLDGQYGYDNQQPMIGWQAELRKRGAIVDTAGFNGAQLASLPDTGAGIFNRVIDNGELATMGFDIENIDHFIIMAGTNDIRNGVAIDQFEWDKDGADNENFTYALDYLLYWLARQGSPKDSRIFACTPLWASESYTSRNTGYVHACAEAVKQVAPYEGATAIDLMSGFLSPATINEYTYDGTHPNRQGMQKMGKIIYKAMEAKL